MNLCQRCKKECKHDLEKCTYYSPAKITNFERIKQMTIEEMAYYFCTDLPICPLKAPHCKDNNCPVCFEHWLESEVNEEE